jgi:multicomponent Na+:H+ antiporter subunit C
MTPQNPVSSGECGFKNHLSGSTSAVDPVVQALTLTDIVVGAAISALLLSLALQVQKRRHTVDPEELYPISR